MSKIMLLIFGMAIVTYIPRVIPFLTISDKELPKPLRLFLEFVPYTALGALLMPGVIIAIPKEPLISIAGLSFACFYSWKKGGMIIPVVGSIIIVFLLLLI